MVLNNSWNSQDPVQVAKGGTGIATTTAYAPIVGGTIATGAFQAASTGLSTSGYVLTSNGASAVPSFQAAPSLLQSAFLAIQTQTIENVTGDNTSYNVPFDSEAYDLNSDFASSTFTAPVKGIYYLDFQIRTGGYASDNAALYTRIVTTDRTYVDNRNAYPTVTGGSWPGYYTSKCSVAADMDAGDTAYAQIMSGNGSKVVDINGSEIYFSGFIVFQRP